MKEKGLGRSKEGGKRPECTDFCLSEHHLSFRLVSDNLQLGMRHLEHVTVKGAVFPWSYASQLCSELTQKWLPA